MKNYTLYLIYLNIKLYIQIQLSLIQILIKRKKYGTLISTFTTIQVLLKNMERDKYAKVVHDELTKLGVEFQRYKERWDKLSRSIETVNRDVENLNITSDKISKKFEAISDVRLDDNTYLE